MKVSLDGLFSNVEECMRSSRDRYACMMAFSMMELGDNLRLLASGEVSVEEFFATYVITDKEIKEDWSESVVKENYACMRDDADEADEAA